ncbi:MAG TPA: adenylate/guanylate cyclase domain-containing protein [Candidatus Eisenbacteria bacterium]|jgi:adenylate cyclase|nr:adenylate/guanylate cyclase domain-containing protein [Candidatus Eisenbacteria bacterium]
MASAPSGGLWQRRGLFGVYELLQSWWRHRVSFLVSVGITVAALALYYFTFLGERPTPIFSFLQRLEFNSLDTRFRYRPAAATPVDPRIVIVDIDQRSQEALGKWPFSRTNFAKMLDVLRADGAKVVALDITFDYPDKTSAPTRKILAELEERKKRGDAVDPKYEAWVRALISEYDADSEFGAALKRFGAVALGNFFLEKEEAAGIAKAKLDEYADLIDWFAMGKNSVNSATGKRDFAELVEKYDREGNLFAATVANIPALANPDDPDKTAMGFFNISADSDGVLRRTLLTVPFGRSSNVGEWQMYGSLEVQAVRLYLGLNASQLTVNYGPVGIVSLDFGDKLRVRPDSTGHMQINYHGPRGAYPYHSIADVVSGKFISGTFKDKIVVVGASATGIGDQRTPPYGGINYPGVEVHVNVIDNLLNQGFLVRGAQQALWDFIAILAFGIPLGLWMALVSPRWMWFGLALLAPLIVLDYVMFLRGWWLNFTVPALTLTGNVVLVSLYRVLIEDKEKRRVRSAFGEFVSPEVIRRLLANPKLVEPRKTNVTVMFSDIRGFTTISEKLDAQDLALFLNEYLLDMTQIVFKHQGTLDKYIGDAVMAFWGAPYEEPNHAIRSCQAALDMIERVRTLQKKWEAEGKPHLEIGIGLNTGVASVGRMGSSLRRGYTALGDAVNLTSRLEGMNKEYGTSILVSESCYKAAKSAEFVFRELDLIRVKGKLQPVTIYELVGREGEIAHDPGTRELLERFAQARSLYCNRSWEQAQHAFETLLAKWPEDGPSRTYWKRCQEYLFEEPPHAWDGVFVMTSK